MATAEVGGPSTGRPVKSVDPRLDSQHLNSKEDPREAKARDRAENPETRPERQKPPRTRPSSRPGPAPARLRFPTKPDTAPILRANPCSEVTDQVCRLPLPTLFYRLEALNLGDLLRIWVRSGANIPRSPLPDFQGPRGRSGHRCNCGALRVPNPISLLEDSRELERLQRKENSLRISRRRLRVSLGCPDEHSCEGPFWNGSATGFRNRNRIPFRP